MKLSNLNFMRESQWLRELRYKVFYSLDLRASEQKFSFRNQVIIGIHQSNIKFKDGVRNHTILTALYRKRFSDCSDVITKTIYVGKRKNRDKRKIQLEIINSILRDDTIIDFFRCLKFMRRRYDIYLSDD